METNSDAGMTLEESTGLALKKAVAPGPYCLDNIKNEHPVLPTSTADAVLYGETSCAAQAISTIDTNFILS